MVYARVDGLNRVTDHITLTHHINLDWDDISRLHFYLVSKHNSNQNYQFLLVLNDTENCSLISLYFYQNHISHICPSKRLFQLQLDGMDDSNILYFIYILSSFTHSKPHEVQWQMVLYQCYRWLIALL